LILTVTHVFQRDFSPASLRLELLVIAHLRTFASAPAEKQFILGLLSAAEKSLLFFKNSTPVRQCCWKLINI